MRTLRYVLAALMVVLGCIVVVRVLSFGLTGAAVTGLVLGGAMIGLGLHRISLLRRAGTKA